MKYLINSVLGLCGLAVAIASCNKEPDESNLYTFTGQTVETFIQNDSNLTAFNYILKRSGLDRNMSTYGQYTCYAPTNEGVKLYIDSLWNDKEAVIPHNGMTSDDLEGLSDSLCNDIAEYHLTNGLYSIISMGGSGATISTMLGRPISSKVSSEGKTVLNDVSTIISEDNEVTNGLVHIIDHVVPRTSRLLGATLQRLPEYSIFSEAAQRTGLADSVMKSKKIRLSPNLVTAQILMVTSFTVLRSARSAILSSRNPTTCSRPTASIVSTTLCNMPIRYMAVRPAGTSILLRKASPSVQATIIPIASTALICSSPTISFMRQWHRISWCSRISLECLPVLISGTMSTEPILTTTMRPCLPHTLMKIWEPQPGKTLHQPLGAQQHPHR